MPIANNEELSERELEILRLLATGVSNKEIASQLSISANTVKVHVRNIFAKIGASSRTEAVLYAMKTGIIPPAAVVVDEAAVEIAANLPVDDMDGDAADEIAGEDVGAAGSAEEDAGSRPVDLSRTQPAHRRLPAWAAWLALVVVLMAAAGGLWAWRANQAAPTIPLPVAAEDAARWKELAPMSIARYGLAAVASEGVIYAIAGQTAGGPTGAVAHYDPATDAWKTLAEKPTPVSDVNAAVIGGEVYVPGGRLANGQATDILEIYDPRQDAWREGRRLPEARSAYALAAHEGLLYLFGGWDGGQFVDTIYRYDPETDTWQEKANLPGRRGYVGAALVGRKIYLLGGYDGQRALDDNLIYLPDLDDEGGNPWDQGQPLPAGRYGMGVAPIAEMIDLAGGIQADEQQPILSLSYLPYNNTWQAFGQLRDQTQTPAYPAVVPVGNFIYVLGGQVNGQPTAANLAFQAIYTLSFPIIR